MKTLEDPLLIDAIEGRGSAAPETSVDEKEDTTADATFPIRFPVVAPENKENVQEEYASEQTGIKICKCLLFLIFTPCNVKFFGVR